MMRAIVVFALLACVLAAPAIVIPTNTAVNLQGTTVGPVTQTNAYATYTFYGFGTATRPSANQGLRVTVTFMATVVSGQDVCFTAHLRYGTNALQTLTSGPNKFCTTSTSKTVWVVAETQYSPTDDLNIIPELVAEIQGNPVVSSVIQASGSVSSVTEDLVESIVTLTSNDYGTQANYSNGASGFRRVFLFPYVSWPTATVTTGAQAKVTAKAFVQSVTTIADFTLCFAGGFIPIKGELFRTNANYNNCILQGGNLPATTVTWTQTFSSLPPPTPYLLAATPAGAKRDVEAAVQYSLNPSAPSTAVTQGPTAGSSGGVQLSFAFANMFVVPKVTAFP